MKKLPRALPFLALLSIYLALPIQADAGLFHRGKAKYERHVRESIAKTRTVFRHDYRFFGGRRKHAFQARAVQGGCSTGSCSVSKHH